MKLATGFFFLLKACDVQMHLPERREVLHNTLSCIDGALPSTQCMLGLSLCALRLFLKYINGVNIFGESQTVLQLYNIGSVFLAIENTYWLLGAPSLLYWAAAPPPDAHSSVHKDPRVSEFDMPSGACFSRPSLFSGIAFPTCVSVNNCVCHFSPLKSDPDYTLKDGDLVKM